MFRRIQKKEVVPTNVNSNVNIVTPGVRANFKPYSSLEEYNKQNQNIVEQIKKNLIKCQSVNRQYKTLHTEFNYTINIVLNMVNLIENNGKLIEEIQRVLKEYGSEIIDSSQLEIMRQNQNKLIQEFKTTYNNLLLRNRQYINPETIVKLQGLLKNLENPPIKMLNTTRSVLPSSSRPLSSSSLLSSPLSSPLSTTSSSSIVPFSLRR